MSAMTLETAGPAIPTLRRKVAGQFAYLLGIASIFPVGWWLLCLAAYLAYAKQFDPGPIQSWFTWRRLSYDMFRGPNPMLSTVVLSVLSSAALALLALWLLRSGLRAGERVQRAAGRMAVAGLALVALSLVILFGMFGIGRGWW